MTTSTTQEIIVRLLGNLGTQREVSQYLRNYASVDAPKFAVIKVSGRVVQSSLEEVASSLSFLKAVGLVPIVVHGSRPQIQAALAGAKESQDVARRATLATGASIVDSLERLGTRARPFTSGVLEVDDDGTVVHVDDDALAASARAGAIPVVSPFGETEAGLIKGLHADEVAHALSSELRPHKVVFLSSRGGLRNEDGALLSAVNLAEDYAGVMADGRLDASSRRTLTSLAKLLAVLPPTSSASVTSPAHLARELFTHGGAGTLVRRGERVQVHDSFADVDTARLRALLEECFGRKLHPDYFANKKPYRIYLAESYRATAILTLEQVGGSSVPYLDKFAVTPEAQGEGVGGSIWQRMRREVPKVFWRARGSNPINGWYAQQADGLFKSDDFWVFWCKMHDFDEIRAAVERALAMPATLKKPPEEP